MLVKLALPLTAAFCLIAVIVFHVVIPFNNAFTEYCAQYNTVDAYYVMRHVDVYPDVLLYDYYINYPDGVPLHDKYNLFQKTLGAMPDAVIPFIPVILFILLLPVVFLITYLLFQNKYVSMMSVVILSVMPGEILHRTSLGAVDYHCWETFMLACVMVAVLLLIRYHRNILATAAIAVWLVVFLIMYQASWQGFPLVLLILGMAAMAIAMLKAHSIVRILLGYGAIMFLLLVAVLRTDTVSYYLRNMVDMFVIIPQQLITEEYPLLFTAGWFDASVTWNYFGITFYLFLSGLGIMVYRIIKYRRATDVTFLIWSVIILLVTLARRRYDYYLAVNVAIMSAYVIYIVVRHLASNRANYIRAVVAASIVVIMPLLLASSVQAASGSTFMPKGWQETTYWLRQQASEQHYINGTDPGYGVLTWRDYGYWVVQAGHTPVLCSPGSGDDTTAANVLISNDDNFALSECRRLQMRYVIIDSEMFEHKAFPVFVATRATLGSPQDYIRVLPSVKVTGYMIQNSLMFRLWHDDIDGFTLVFQSADSKVKVFEVKQ